MDAVGVAAITQNAVWRPDVSLSWGEAPGSELQAWDHDDQIEMFVDWNQ